MLSATTKPDFNIQTVQGGPKMQPTLMSYKLKITKEHMTEENFFNFFIIQIFYNFHSTSIGSQEGRQADIQKSFFHGPPSI